MNEFDVSDNFNTSELYIVSTGIADRTVFHGSKVIVEIPEIRTVRKSKDFGQGFYCTNMKKQAIRWATRFGNGNVTEYKYVQCTLLKILYFSKMTEEWLDFIIDCRLGKPHIYDIVEGPMADDEVFLSVQDYIRGNITREAFWELVKFRYPTHQISFHTFNAINTLTYTGYEAVIK